MDKPLDLYFLAFASIFLFAVLITSIIISFAYYRSRQRRNFMEKEELKTAFRQELLQSQLEIQEQVLNHISQEIHDNVGQVLSLAKVQIGIINESGDMSSGMLGEVNQNITRAMGDLRDIARSLSSERNRSLNIATAVAGEAERFNKIGTLQVHVQVKGEEKTMNEHKQLILFRAIQESMQNILKHASASRVDINFDFGSEALLVVIRDNGRGFNAQESTKSPAGLGLINIRTRTILAGGNSEIQSDPGSGTVINIQMPYA